MSETTQLRPLLVLRWRMLRSARARWGFALLGAAAPLLCVAAGMTGALTAGDRASDITLLAPTAFLSAAVLAVLAPLVAGGGNELFPDDQLVAYPVTARTRYLASLALTPLNLAWLTQLVGLVGITALITAANGSGYVPALLTCLAYVAMVTVAGQAIGWLVVGIREHPVGRASTWVIATGLTGSAIAVVLLDRVVDVVQSAPATFVVIGIANGATGDWSRWLVATSLFAAVTAVAGLAGQRACAWALRQPGDARSRIDTHVARRRPRPRTARELLLATDRSSVWRSPSLRRGLLVLGVLPGLVAALAGLQWSSLVLLPGLVAAGAGLLFGVNAFCLDGSGAVWLASLPGSPAAAFWSKAQVVGEVCVVAMAFTMIAGSLRANGGPTIDEAAAMLAGSATSMLWVVATCMHLSVTRPHGADLRGPRDTPAPPGAMAVYSARLAVATTMISMLFAGLSQVAPWHQTSAIAVLIGAVSLHRLLRAERAWDTPGARARVAVTVATG